MLSVTRVTVQTLVFILHYLQHVPNLTMCATRCVGGSEGGWGELSCMSRCSNPHAQSFSTRRLSRGQSHGCEVYRMTCHDLTQSLGGAKVCAHPPPSFWKKRACFSNRVPSSVWLELPSTIKSPKIETLKVASHGLKACGTEGIFSLSHSHTMEMLKKTII